MTSIFHRIAYALLSLVILAHFVFVLIKSKNPKDAVESLKKDTAIKWLTRILLIVAIFGMWKVVSYYTIPDNNNQITQNEEVQNISN